MVLLPCPAQFCDEFRSEFLSRLRTERSKGLSVDPIIIGGGVIFLTSFGRFCIFSGRRIGHISRGKYIERGPELNESISA